MKIEKKQTDIISGLYLVATPIGNLGDITLRAIEILKKVDLIYCEDTRQTRKLLSAYDIKTKTATYHDYSEESVRSKIVKQVAEGGMSVALVSDAGMPLVSDPGYKLVRDFQVHDLYVTSLPGANALLTALQLSGLPSEPFMFLGFLPPKEKARRDELKKWQNVPATLIFYEAKQRVLKTIQDLHDLYGNRQICVIRELTKMFEEVICGTSGDVLERIKTREELKGEFVILAGPPVVSKSTGEELKEQITSMLKNNIPVKEIAMVLAGTNGFSKKDIYDLAVKLKSE